MTGGVVVLFLLGPTVVVPLLLRRVPPLEHPVADRLRRLAEKLALPAGISLAIAFALPAGSIAGFMALPWAALGGLTALAAAIDAGAAIPTRRVLRPGVHHAIWASLLFLAVAGGNALADRSGVQPFGFAPLIVLLTAVHFTFAGFVLVLHGALTWRERPSRGLERALGAVVIGIPVTAIGFFGVPPAAWLGALLVAGGGLGVAAATIAVAPGRRSRASRWLLRLAGAALLVTLPLAAVYATGQFMGAAWLSIPAMVATHGIGNVLAFSVPAALAWTLDHRALRPSGGPVDALDVVGLHPAPFQRA